MLHRLNAAVACRFARPRITISATVASGWCWWCCWCYYWCCWCAVRTGAAMQSIDDLPLVAMADSGPFFDAKDSPWL